MAEHDMRQADRSPPAGTGREGAPERDDALRDESGRLPGVLTPIEPAAFGYEQARHLLLRAGFGGTPEQIRTLANWGPERAVDHLLNVEAVEYKRPTAEEFDKNIMRPPSEAEQAEYRAAARRGDEDTLARFRLQQQQSERADRDQVRQMQRWWLTRLIETPKPLEEKMTLFWHGHFATSHRTIENSYHMYMQNQLFRSKALGNFGELLFAIIRDPAMIAYLDNNDSRAGMPNENLARELMELFSLGVGNYTEQDIKEGARALTGYTYADDAFYFNERNHDQGSKAILGARGNLDGDDFVKAILGKRECARFISMKLYDFFALHVLHGLPEGPEGKAVDRAIGQMAAEMLRSRYDVKPVLRKLFLSEHFYHPRVMNERIKSPAEVVVGAVRSLRAPVRDLNVLLQAMDLMGQSLMFPPSVKGWDGGRAWINTATLFVRQNILNFVLTGKLPVGYDAKVADEKFDPSPLLAPLAQAEAGAERDARRVAEYLLRFAVGRADDVAMEKLVAFSGVNGGKVTPDLVTGMLVLISALPEYQLC